MTPGPNILMIVFDTARADVFEPYGAAAGTTPAVRQLAAAGAAAPLAYAPASWTVPSHVSLFTGLLPRSAGVAHHGGASHDQFRAAMQLHEDRLLPAVLRRRGWATRAVSANHWIHPHSGFDLGFDEFRPVRSERAAVEGTGRRAVLRWYADALQARLDDGANQIESLLRDWRRSSTQPFFWFVNLIECHSPYLPPAPHTPLSPLGRLLSARDARTHLNFGAIWKANVTRAPIPVDAIERMRSQYDGSIRQLDAWLARVMQDLDDAGVLDDTQVIVTSDHGENLGENDLIGHAFSLDDRLLKVPLVTGGPLELACDRQPVSLTELPAMLGDALGVAHPWEASPWAGTAVAQFDAPGTRGDTRLADAIEKWDLGPEAVEVLCTSFACATDGRFKLFRRAGRDQLVDLRADPLERAPRPFTLTGADPDHEALGRLRTALDAAERAEVAPIDGADTSTVVDDEETKRIEEQMRLLGYL